MESKMTTAIVIGVILVVGVILISFYFGKEIKPGEQNSAPAPAIDESTIEATILNLSTEMVIVNKAGISGKLYGHFAKVRIDKIINYTRYDYGHILKFNPLAIGDIISIAFHEPSDVENMSTGDKILVNIYGGSGYGEPMFDRPDIWMAKE